MRTIRNVQSVIPFLIPDDYLILALRSGKRNDGPILRGYYYVHRGDGEVIWVSGKKLVKASESDWKSISVSEIIAILVKEKTDERIAKALR